MHDEKGIKENKKKIKNESEAKMFTFSYFLVKLGYWIAKAFVCNWLASLCCGYHRAAAIPKYSDNFDLPFLT